MTSSAVAPAASAEPAHPGSAWLRYQYEQWFGPADPRVLAICRILIFWFLWPGFRFDDYGVYAAFQSSAWYPVSFFRAWSVPLLGASSLQLMSGVAAIASLSALLGFLYPIAAPIAAVLTLYLHGVPQNFGKVNHAENLFILALLVFAFARAADAWSLDAWLKRRFGMTARALPSGHYRWPVRFIMLMIVTMYAAAGVSKLVHSGFDWALTDSFRRLLLRHHFTHDPPTRIGVWLADFPFLCNALALGALSTELSSPLALSSKWLQRLLIPVLFTLQASIWLMMGVLFLPMLPLFLCLLPWHSAVSALDRAQTWVSSRRSDGGGGG